jgi:hypothetical protein
LIVISGVRIKEKVKSDVFEEMVFEISYRDKEILNKKVYAEFRICGGLDGVTTWTYVVKNVPLKEFTLYKNEYGEVFRRVHEKIYKHLMNVYGYKPTPIRITHIDNIAFPVN